MAEAPLNPWMPDTRIFNLAALGKLAEELGECSAAVARCVIQGIDEVEPVTGKPNRQWLEDEIADVLANIPALIDHFGLDRERMELRIATKVAHLDNWRKLIRAELRAKAGGA